MKSIILSIGSSILFISTLAIATTASAQNDRDLSQNQQNKLNLPTVKNAIDIEKSIGRSVKLVGTYIGTPSILSYKESSSGQTLLLLEAKIVTSDNISISLYSKEPMLGQLMRPIDEIKKYHDREVIVTGEITKTGKYLSIIPEKIEQRRFSLTLLPHNTDKIKSAGSS
jgi:hypothetical protein